MIPLNNLLWDKTLTALNLFFTFRHRPTFYRISDCYGLLDGLATFDFGRHVLTEGFFTWTFFEWHHFPFLAGLAVLADCLKSLAVGAPAVPGFLIFSPDPAAIRAFFA
jgi:hypothetical protein